MLTYFQRQDRLKAPLDVITVVFNSARYRSRWALYEDFSRSVNIPAVRLWTVEVAFGQRNFVVTRKDEPRHLQLRTDTEIWHKERAQNLMLSRVVTQEPEARYIAFVDADVTFSRPDWADETRHALQHYSVVQMWGEAYDLDADGHILQSHDSFVRCYSKGMPLKTDGGNYYYPGRGGKRIYWHPGYAWGWRREALDKVGGLIDWAILGSADFHMAHGLVGNIATTFRKRLAGRYKDRMREWETLAEQHIKRNVGCVPGSVLHAYHGSKKARQYQSRWKILEQTQFDPDKDLTTDAQGLYRLRHHGDQRSNQLRDKVRNYFHSRDEDR